MPASCRRATAWIAAFLLPVAVAVAQARPEQVAGKVTGSRDGRPVAQATVTLRKLDARATSLSVRSADDGSFHFDGVPDGRYELSAEAPGYLRGSYLQHEEFFCGVVTGAGLATGSLDLQLRPAATISGNVTDETGEPVAQGRVTLYREAPDSANGRVRRARTAMTEDDGHYEFDDLEPGRYFVSASATPWYAVHPTPSAEHVSFPYEPSLDPALDVAYPTVFYPNALSSDGAIAIRIAGGEEVSADMQMTPEHAMTLSVQRPPGEPFNGAAVQLVTSVFGLEEPNPVQMTFVNGVQTLVGIAPGQYRVDEFAPGSNLLIRSQQVDLSSGPVVLDAAPQSALATLKVTLQYGRGNTLPAGSMVMLQRSGSGQNRAFPGQASAQGVVELHGVPAGEYRVRVFEAGRMLRVTAVAIDGHASPDRVVNVTGAGEANVVVSLGGQMTRIVGTAQRGGKASPGTMIVLVPAGSDTGPDLFRRDESDLDGAFTLRDVLPGRYILIAIEGGWNLRWDDAEALMPYLVHGIPVEVPVDGGAEMRLREPVPALAR